MKRMFGMLAVAVVLLLAACGQSPGDKPNEELESLGDYGLLAVGIGYDYQEGQEDTNLNGQFDKGEVLLGGWPFMVTPVDKEGQPVGEGTVFATKDATDPLESFGTKLPEGDYRLDFVLPETFENQGKLEYVPGELEPHFITLEAKQINIVITMLYCARTGELVEAATYAQSCLPKLFHKFEFKKFEK